MMQPHAIRSTVLSLLFLALGLAPPAAAQDLEDGTWVDLTHPFDQDAIYWPSATEFQHRTVSEGYTEKGYYYSAYDFTAAEHGGTHVDAPIHFVEGRMTVDELPVDRLIGPAVVVDVAEAASRDRDYRVSVDDFETWEEQHGRLPEGCIVLLDTGSARLWPDRVAYMGTDKRGEEGVAGLHFPGLHPDAATWLVENRSIRAIGLDTPSIDHGPSTHFRSHRILFEANIPALENVANLDALPPKGAWLFALPMKIQGGSGAPTRIVAFVPE